MEIYNDILCVDYNAISGIVSGDTLRQWVARGKVEQVRRGCRGTSALFAVDSLPPKYKEELYRRFPDMKSQAESKPFVDSIDPDGVAIAFYEGYELADNRYFDPKKQREYSNNAAILNTFKALLDRSNSHRLRQGNKKVKKEDFWDKAVRAITSPLLMDEYPHSLPTNARRLQQKFNDYQRGGYESLISGKFLNRNASKVDDSIKESLLIQLISDPNNLNNEQIRTIYNAMARVKEWAVITTKPIEMMRRKYDLLTAGGRLGETRFRNQKSMQVKRTRPTLPLLYWTTDGWTAELLYQRTDVNKKGHNVTTYTNRLTIVVVLDPCVDYPIGYAIGERENPKLIREALRNSADHTAELFGRRYRTNQLQSDNYGRGALTPTYKVMGDQYTPARAHNAKAKVIEPYFNHLNRTYCQLYRNWAGFGITSNKNLQPNSDFLNKQRHSFPDEAGCRAQLVEIMEQEREAKREQYLALFEKLPEDRLLPLSTEQYLLMFGAETGHKNAIEGRGMLPTIEGVKMVYDCFDPKFREYAHVRWTVKYDPNNLDTIMAVNDDATLRFMLEKKHEQPMAIADQTEEDKIQLKRVNGFNKNLESNITKTLALTYKNVEELFEDNPQLDIATRLLLCDSKGQNKNHKSTRKSKPLEIDEKNYKTINSYDMPIGEESPYDLY